MQLLPPEQLASPPENTDVLNTWLDTSTWATHVSERYQFTIGQWVQAFCDQYVETCSDAEGMAEPAFASDGDREGLLRAWDDGMSAFIPTWYDEAEAVSIWEQPAPTDGRIYIVECGRPDSDSYRSRDLVEAFSTSLCVPAERGRSERRFASRPAPTRYPARRAVLRPSSPVTVGDRDAERLRR